MGEVAYRAAADSGAPVDGCRAEVARHRRSSLRPSGRKTDVTSYSPALSRIVTGSSPNFRRVSRRSKKVIAIIPASEIEFVDPECSRQRAAVARPRGCSARFSHELHLPHPLQADTQTRYFSTGRSTRSNSAAWRVKPRSVG